MKLRISDLTDAGIEVNGTLAPSALNQRLNGESDSGIAFEMPVDVKMHARRTAGGAELSGKLSGSYKQNCGRCLDPVARDFEISATFLIKPKPRGENLVDDVGVIYFAGEHCDLESPLQETVLLSMSLYWSPELDQKGKCTGCNKDCKRSSVLAENSDRTSQEPKNTRLGDLLKNLK